MATVRVPELKVILCGEYGVGKSSIFRRFTNNTFVTATDRQSTLGLDHFHKIYKVGDKDVKVIICTPFISVLNFIRTVTVMGYRWYGTSCFDYVKLLQVCRGSSFGVLIG